MREEEDGEDGAALVGWKGWEKEERKAMLAREGMMREGRR